MRSFFRKQGGKWLMVLPDTAGDLALACAIGGHHVRSQNAKRFYVDMKPDTRQMVYR